MTGLVRGLQADITTIIAVMLAIIFFYVVGRYLAGKLTNGEDRRAARSTVNVAAVISLAAIVLVFGWRSATYTTSMRIPRADIDGRAVYHRMNETLQPTR